MKRISKKVRRALLFAARPLNEDEQIHRDRQAVVKGAAVGTAGALAAGVLLRKARGPVRSLPVKIKPGGRKKNFATRERDRGDNLRDAAVAGGAVASGGAAIYGARSIAKTSRRARQVVKEVAPKIEPKEVVREGIDQLSRRAKKKVKEYFPTFAKGAKILKKRLFSAEKPKKKPISKEEKRTIQGARVRNALIGAAAGSFLGGQLHGGKSGYKGARVGAGAGAAYGLLSDPKRRAAIEDLQTAAFSSPARELLEFGGKEQWKEEGSNVYASPLKAAAGMQRVYYRKDSDGKGIVEDMPVAHAQTVRSALRVADKVNRSAKRATSLGKDVVDSVKGKPRERDAAGRPKKREWEKSWFKDGVQKAAIAGGVLGGTAVLRKSPKARAAFKKAARKVADKANEVVPGMVPHKFSTPAGRILRFAVKEETPKTDIVKSAIGGAAAGSLVGEHVAKNGAKARRYSWVNQQRVKQERVRVTKATVDDRLTGKVKATKPFGKGVLTNREKIARATRQAGIEYHKGVKRSVIGGGVAGAVVAGAAQAGINKLKQRKAKDRAFDSSAADAGWDIRDPRGKSARVFAPGSRKRERRQKTWIEQVENERKVRNAGTVAAAAAGLAGGVLIGRRLRKTQITPVKSGGNIVPMRKRA